MENAKEREGREKDDKNGILSYRFSSCSSHWNDFPLSCTFSLSPTFHFPLSFIFSLSLTFHFPLSFIFTFLSSHAASLSDFTFSRHFRLPQLSLSSLCHAASLFTFLSHVNHGLLSSQQPIMDSSLSPSMTQRGTCIYCMVLCCAIVCEKYYTKAWK